MTNAKPNAAYFDQFAPCWTQQTALRSAIIDAYRLPERELVPALAAKARVDQIIRSEIADTAQTLITSLRGKSRRSVVEELVQEYALSSQEGVALMCLAEALLRIPDNQTRDALIRDKIADGNWASHLGGGSSLFVNAATWGLVVTGKLTSPVQEGSLRASLTRLIARFGEPLIRRGVDMALRMMGEQFVMGETIANALQRAESEQEKGFTYSYDMLGEAALTAEDAARYFASYQNAIHAIGRASAGRGIYLGPGISIKLSALHPRYSRAQQGRVMSELLPRLKTLAVLACNYGIGLNIDAEESDRLELSLDLLESLSADEDLAGWNGLGFVVQAYGKRCPYVIDFIIDLARRTNRRIMVRLVKGAYWDAEIKRAQVDGLEDFPVFTRKVYTDVSYLACAKTLLAAKNVVFPQFATHNAQTLAAIYHIAGPDFRLGDYEFQCLHGMGEPLYEEVVGPEKLDRPCRIYAPVGTHETLLAYLVRRLLENGANSSFVNRIADPEIPVTALITDPVEDVLAMAQPGEPHPAIRLPRSLFQCRENSAGIDLSNEHSLAALAGALRASAARLWTAAPAVGAGQPPRSVNNPADNTDQVGTVIEATEEGARVAATIAGKSAKTWAATDCETRRSALLRAADTMQKNMPLLIGLIMREAGKTAANAIGEVREAIDFLRYYADQATALVGAGPLGAVACISPWNFPLAIFTGQVAAALAAGNAVLAKPAEETPLIAAEAIRLLHAAGVPDDVLQLLPGDGRIGAALVNAPEVQGVIFTGSTEVARTIQRALSQRFSSTGSPIPLIAETGGQNAMIVDSSALAEQVVADVITSAFDSAGQRCSALRILCLQKDIADKTLAMLGGALDELTVAPTAKLSVDIGPVISAEAKARIEAHISAMKARGHKVQQISLPLTSASGTFVPPTIIEIDHIVDVKHEVFGPVLHVLRYHRDQIGQVINDINATGYGLTFGLHTRIDETISYVTDRIRAGNIYINRNIIGAVVGVQPFGGRGLSGTGPKAGGPLYLHRLVTGATPSNFAKEVANRAANDFSHWCAASGRHDTAISVDQLADKLPCFAKMTLEGPVGEENIYSLQPRGRVFVAPTTAEGLYSQLAIVLATGNDAVIDISTGLTGALTDVPSSVTEKIEWVSGVADAGPVVGALVEGDGSRAKMFGTAFASLNGPLVPIQCATTDQLRSGTEPYCMSMLLEEVSISINTTAAGGNASLMSLEL